jgi:uncharacterized HAD superfamily protein
MKVRNRYKKPLAVCLDWDDSCSNFIGNLLRIHNGLYGTKYTREIFSNWQMPEDIRMTFKTYENEIYASQPLLPKVRKKLKKIKRMGYKIIFITARPEAYRKVTLFNLALNNINYDAIYFSKNKTLKINKLMKKFNIKAFADDNINTVNKVAEHTKVKHVYLITRSYNRNVAEHKRVKRIFNLEDVKC